MTWMLREAWRGLVNGPGLRVLFPANRGPAGASSRGGLVALAS